jgi:hypothetical protein
MVRQIARAGAGGPAGRWRRHGQDRGGDLVVCGPAVNIREVLDAAGLASLVDEVETREVEMTHD